VPRRAEIPGTYPGEVPIYQQLFGLEVQGSPERVGRLFASFARHGGCYPGKVLKSSIWPMKQLFRAKDERVIA
jgi:hypothetical protein